jgi:hypothetical protein
MTSFADLVAESPAERAVRTYGPVPDPPAPEPGKVLTLRLDKAGEWYWHQSNDWRDLQYWAHKAAGSWPEPEPEPEPDEDKGSEQGVAGSIAPKATQAATSPAKPARRPLMPGTPSTRRPPRNSREETGWFPGWGMDWRG